MKTRSFSKKIFVPWMAVGALMMSVPEAYSQFKKFNSPSRFKPQEEKAENSPGANNFAGGPEGDDEVNSNTFGNRVNTNDIIGSQKDSPFVNLNPETAFGPEIVTSFDFPDTDILEITKHMQKLTGINLILDKDVKGKVSITAPTAITVGDAWKAYLAALNMAGYTLVKSGAFYKVINARDVRYTPTKIYTGAYTPDTEAHVMKVIALKNVDASEIARNFRPFMSRYGRIIDIKQTNTVIASDAGTNINRLEKMIKFLDVPGHEDSLHIIAVKNSSAQEIAKLLDTILKGNTSTRSRPTAGSPSSSRFSSSQSSENISKIIAEPRTNSIIAMANADGARQLKELIGKLDVKLISSSSGKIHVHYLNYGNAEELAKTLSNLISGAKTADTGNRNPNSRFAPSGNEDSAIFNSEVKVTADKDNNALVVTASPTDWLTIKNVINKLDIPRDQVYVEGLILETTIRKVRGFGVDYMGAYGAGAAQRAGFASAAAGGSIIDLIGTGPQSLSGFFGGFGVGGTHEIQIGDQKLKVSSVNGLVKAIATNSNSNVLATPQILAMDNTEAEFEVGQTVPVQKTTTSSAGITTTSTENQEAKLSLKITPQINKVTRFVKLKINQTINDFIGETNTSGTGLATTTRSAITEVMVRDRDTIAMGGLLRDKDDVSVNKIPLLGDIPVLGWLFKSKDRRTEKINLLMFLTPRILSPYDGEAASTTLSKINKRKEYLDGVLDKDEKDLYEADMNRIRVKVEKQAEAPLYDTSLGDRYKSNDDTFNKVNE